VATTRSGQVLCTWSPPRGGEVPIHLRPRNVAPRHGGWQTGAVSTALPGCQPLFPWPRKRFSERLEMLFQVKASLFGVIAPSFRGLSRVRPTHAPRTVHFGDGSGAAVTLHGSGARSPAAPRNHGEGISARPFKDGKAHGKAHGKG
jgi:hypothetical protein